MRKAVITIIATLIWVNFYSQDNLARLKYEEAEEAFEKGNYAISFQKINETEAILKGSNPKTLYLKIVSQYNLFKEDYAYIKGLKKDCNLYLTKYGNRDDIVDKYKEIYGISEEIKPFSDSPETIELEKKKEVEKNKAIAENEVRINSSIKYAENLSLKYYFKPGLSKNDFNSQNTFLVNLPLKKYDNGNFFKIPSISYTPDKKPNACGVDGFITDNNGIVIEYSYTIECGKKMQDQHLNSYNLIRKEIYNNFEKQFITESKGKYGGVRLIVAVPKSSKDYSIAYYITYAFNVFEKESAISIRFSTTEELAYF